MIRDKVLNYLRKGKFISGMANCHVPGVYSIVFEQRTTALTGMLRMFYAETDVLARLEDDNDFVVMPHNHRQNLALSRLCGRPYQVWLDFHSGKDTLHCYQFKKSALLEGEFDLEWKSKLTKCDLFPDPIRDYTYMAWDQAHTVMAPAGSAWAVQELELAPERGLQVCFSRSNNKRLDSFGLYEKLSNEETAEVVRKVYELCAKS